MTINNRKVRHTQMSDDYRELVEGAKDALGDLLRETEPGTGLLLHRAYAELRAMLARPTVPDRIVPPGPGGVEDDYVRAYRESKGRFMELSDDERLGAILGVLGDSKLTIREITAAVDALRDDWKVEDSTISSTVARLLQRRELARVKMQRGNRTVWVYFRRTELEGPIVELARTLGGHDA